MVAPAVLTLGAILGPKTATKLTGRLAKKVAGTDKVLDIVELQLCDACSVAEAYQRVLLAITEY